MAVPSSSQHQVRIEDIAFGGRGVGRLEDGRAVFVPYVLAGENVRVEIVRAHRRHVEARLLSVDEPSPERVTPPCPYFGRCGGCSYQHMSAAEQLRVKERQVTQAVRRIGRCADVAVEAIVSSPEAYEYRNRITVHFDEERAGFFAAGGREVVDIERCWIAEPPVNTALAEFRGQWRRRPPGAGHVTLRARPGKRSFEQTNAEAAAELLRIVHRLAGAERRARIIDAYCGSGFFLKTLTDRCDEAIGLEWDSWAVEAARANAGPNERYVAGDVALSLESELSKPSTGAGALLICDPPAAGLSTEVCDIILRQPPAAIIYISCDPATLARDLARLTAGYRPMSVQPLDMFPQTAEIEVVAQFSRLP